MALSVWATLSNSLRFPHSLVLSKRPFPDEKPRVTNSNSYCSIIFRCMLDGHEMYVCVWYGARDRMPNLRWEMEKLLYDDSLFLIKVCSLIEFHTHLSSRERTYWGSKTLPPKIVKWSRNRHCLRTSQPACVLATTPMGNNEGKGGQAGPMKRSFAKVAANWKNFPEKAASRK